MLRARSQRKEIQERVDVFEDWRECLNGCQELKHLIGASTSFLLSFGDSLPSWHCLESLLAAHTWCVKFDQLELEGSCRGGSRQTPEEMQTCLPAFLGFPVRSIEQR